ncbi:MAG TPA: NAD+ synthase, partial [Rhodothermales bacterium]|nr:NAD+ synthase [Rhodothermales bacterium]
MKIALCQTNPIVGDLAGNVALVLRDARRAAEQGARLAVFPELCVTGYPPMDLLDRPQFIRDVEAAVERIAAEAPAGLALIIGAPTVNETPKGKRLYNSALVIQDGAVQDAISKTLLPTYDVFDEYRYFEPCEERRVVEVDGLRLGLHVCEDMWNNEEHAPYHLYRANPIDELAALGIDLFVNISASPYSVGKPEERAAIIAESCREHGVPFVYVNTVGANTELIFDGDSRVHGADGEERLRLPLWEEALAIWDTDAPGPAQTPRQPDAIGEIHDALVLGIADYVRKTGDGVFEKALIGLSGGIDSAVTCALAAAA